MITYTPRGVCSHEMTVSLDSNKKIQSVNIAGGCTGNLTAVAKLCEGQDALEMIDKLRGIKCGFKSTSCPDQLSYAIEKALSQQP